jgi:phenylacetate-CoA ligase
MIKVRGVPLFPSQVDSLLGGIAGVSSEYQLVVERTAGRDELTLRIECAEPLDGAARAELVESVTHAFRAAFELTPNVETLDVGGLPRTERKTNRVIDKRNL